VSSSRGLAAAAAAAACRPYPSAPQNSARSERCCELKEPDRVQP